MSGTSADGINAALVDFNSAKLTLVDASYTPFSSALQKDIIDLCHPGLDEINRLSKLDVELGKQFACAAKSLIAKNKLKTHDIAAIGSHGQTIRHHPEQGFTLQIGDPNRIAAETGITTIADFRRRDIALNGQGAPLVPGFHQAYFGEDRQNRIILNIGGISNITLLQPSKPVLGFDSGPGNTLLDAWIEKHRGLAYDAEGAWAKEGAVIPSLLKKLLNDPYFQRKPPKSSGREYFNLTWLNSFLSTELPVDVQTTLMELTVTSIVNAIKSYCSQGDIFVAGGGIHNAYLMQRLQELAKPLTVQTTAQQGIDPDYVEAIAFAWLAKRTLERKSGNVCSVTGAKEAAILGGVYFV